jgi:hypothetical protein
MSDLSKAECFYPENKCSSREPSWMFINAGLFHTSNGRFYPKENDESP